MAQLDEEVVDVIHSGVASLTKGTNLFHGPIKPPGNGVPGKSVWAFISGGSPPEFYCDGGSGTNLKRVAVQILVRGPKGPTASSTDYEDGIDLAIEVWEAVQNASTATGLTYGIVCQQSGPLYIGQDKQGYHQWSINTLVFKEE